jgi:hypothetical protein
VIENHHRSLNRINRKLQSGKQEIDGSVFGALSPKTVFSEIGKPLLEPVKLMSVKSVNFKRRLTQTFDQTISSLALSPRSPYISIDPENFFF